MSNLKVSFSEECCNFKVAPTAWDSGAVGVLSVAAPSASGQGQHHSLALSTP